MGEAHGFSGRYFSVSVARAGLDRAWILGLGPD